MAGSNKSKDKKSVDQQKKAPDHGSAGDYQKTKPANGKKKNKSNSKPQKSSGWSFLAKLNLLLLLTVAALAGRVLYLHSDGGSSDLTSAQGRLLASWHVLAAAGQRYGGSALDQAKLGYAWAAGHASRLDVHLTKTQPDYYLPVKGGAGRAAATLRHYGGVASERALVVGAQAAKHAYTAGEAGWTAAQPYLNATLTAARPYWQAAAARAAPLWDAAAEKGRAVKAGVLELGARLREDSGPVLQQWAEAAQRAAGNAWDAVQTHGPVYANKAWHFSCEVCCVARETAQAVWKVIRTEVPVYTEAAGKWVSQTVASLNWCKMIQYKCTRGSLAVAVSGCPCSRSVCHHALEGKRTPPPVMQPLTTVFSPVPGVLTGIIPVFLFPFQPGSVYRICLSNVCEPLPNEPSDRVPCSPKQMVVSILAVVRRMSN